MSKGNLEKWRSGAIPRGTSLQKLADYFNVSTDYLLGNEHKRSPVDDDEAEVWRIRDEMRKKPGLRVLFDLSKNATPEDLELINQIIRKMVGRNNE